MVETAAPETPAQLLTALQAIFPGFEYQVDSDDLRPLTFHGILVDFIDYFGANNSAFDERQLQRFAKVVNQSVNAGGQFQNAFDTCFLEHLSQVKAHKTLVRLLSDAAKLRVR